jgi:hypothetical protein
LSRLIDLFPFQNRARAPLFQPGGFKKMAAIAFTDAQLEQIRMTAAQLPRRLRRVYLERVVQLLNGRDFGDADV